MSDSKPNTASRQVTNIETSGISKQNQEQEAPEKTPTRPPTKEERLAELREYSAEAKANSHKNKNERDSNS
jgi:hypothetical protein